MRYLLGLLLLLILPATSLASEVRQPDRRDVTYGCPVPVGLEVEAERRTAEKISQFGATGDGWYSTFPVPLSTSYLASFPVSLDLADTPVLIGPLWGGPGYGDRIDRRLICGHSLEIHDWIVLIEAINGGYASLDIRELLVDQPLPTTEGSHAIAPHSFRFEIGGLAYQYVVTGITVDLVKVWRPDLVEMRQRLGVDLPATTPDASDPEAVWPVLGSVTGLLFAQKVPPWLPGRDAAGAPGARDAAAVGSALMGSFLDFSTAHREQPSDLSTTPVYIGKVFGASRAQFPDLEYRNGFDVALAGETLIVTRENGGSTEVDLAGWFDRQSGETIGKSALISAPIIDFDLDGVSYKLLVTLLFANASPGADGRLVFDGDRIGGDLFASRPPT